VKWIGQHIVDFIARFRSDIYLENIADGTVASDKFLGLDSNNKIVKETVSAGITVSDSAANTDFPIVFHDESNNLHDDTGSFTYNPSAGTLKVTDLDITGAANALTVSSTDDNVAINTISTDPDCMIRIQDNGTAATNAMGMVATGDDLCMRNDEGSFKVKTNNNADTALTLTQAGSMILLGGLVTPGIELGASDTTIVRSAAGTVTIEGNEIITTATQGIVRNVTTTIDSSAMNSLHSSAVELVANPGSGKWVCPIDQWLVIDKNGTNNNSVNLCTSWNSSTTLTQTSYLYKRFFYNETADVFFRMVRYGADYGTLDPSNKNLTIKLDGAIDANAITSMKVYTQYMILDY